MQWEQAKGYAVKHKDADTRMLSRSGGIFTALSDLVLQQNGIVYGCVLTDEFEAVHIRAENTSERNRMRGSKYIESNMADCYKMVEKDLKEQRSVLFSGTSCQIAGLKGFLGKEYDRLLCVDLVCHGVPSPLVWKKYVNWQERNREKCLRADFRNKMEFGWKDHVETLWLEKKNGKVRKMHGRVYTTLYYGHWMLRPCCYKCPYKSQMHPGDITIADFWEIDRAVPGFNDNKGVSLVLINNSHGEEAFERVKNSVEYRKTRMEDCIKPTMLRSAEIPENRTQFWNDFHNRAFTFVARKYGGYGLIQAIKKEVLHTRDKIEYQLKKRLGL